MGKKEGRENVIKEWTEHRPSEGVFLNEWVGKEKSD